MAYKDFVKSEFEKNNWIEAAESFKGLEGKKVLIFTHDDPDGLTSGCLLKRFVERLGAQTCVKLPDTYELEESRLDGELEKDDYYMVIVADKGTVGYYDDYVGKVDKFVVIDHHPPIGEIKKCLLINPNVVPYKICSTSYIIHMLMTYHGNTDEYDDYLALVGLKGDWAVEPATDIVSDYVKEFYCEKIEGRFGNLIKKIESRPTIFEVNQRKVTTLLNQITELYFALGGGGFQYFYNDMDLELKNVDQALLSFDVMEKHAGNFNNGDWGDLETFIQSTSDQEKVNLIFKYFLEAWEGVVNKFSTAAYLTAFGETDIYLFLGSKISLMPMAGSVYLSELKKKSSGKEVVFIMINCEVDGGVHFSIRGTKDYVHAGKICSTLAKRLVEKYNNKDQITGGGHFVAAECKTRKSGVALSGALSVFFNLIMDMEKTDKEGNSGMGGELGLEYLV
jgi:hypothetical protein